MQERIGNEAIIEIVAAQSHNYGPRNLEKFDVLTGSRNLENAGPATPQPLPYPQNHSIHIPLCWDNIVSHMLYTQSYFLTFIVIFFFHFGNQSFFSSSIQSSCGQLTLIVEQGQN